MDRQKPLLRAATEAALFGLALTAITVAGPGCAPETSTTALASESPTPLPGRSPTAEPTLQAIITAGPVITRDPLTAKRSRADITATLVIRETSTAIARAKPTLIKAPTLESTPVPGPTTTGSAPNSSLQELANFTR